MILSKFTDFILPVRTLGVRSVQNKLHHIHQEYFANFSTIIIQYSNSNRIYYTCSNTRLTENVIYRARYIYRNKQVLTMGLNTEQTIYLKC